MCYYPVTLRAPIQADSDHYFKWINNKELVLFNSDFRPISRENHDLWFNNLPLRKDIIVFSIIENKTNTLIGSCSLRNIDEHNKTAELQIRIGEDHALSRGLGSNAIKQLVAYAFNVRLLKRIYLNVFTTNTRAINAYIKCGFQTDSILKKGAYINNQQIDIQIMSIKMKR